jgi:alginate O-acetyltransferase complex protein AlgI
VVFSSPIFLFLFLPVVVTLYWVFPGLKARNYWLLISSLVFYAWGEILFLFLLCASTLANYLIGLWLDRTDDPHRRKVAIVIAIVLNIGILAFFKYANFVADNVAPAFQWLGLLPLHSNIPLPIGISFFTFHALSYVIDIYRRKSPAATNPADTALYIFFFPQLIAGPILRWNAIAPQLRSRTATPELFAEGVRRFVWGLSKKMIIANVVAVPADQIFALSPGELSPSVAWFGLICYTLQIYFDFSGYSDMAVGLGKMFGFKFIENFNYPYISQSIREFWRRWHISLSTWFRDYLYIPLGGSRVSEPRTYLNLMTVFFLCGLWHGASWTFAVWGLYHGAFLVLERTRVGDWIELLPRPFRHVYALLAVLGGWVLFRADSWGHAMGYFSALAGLGPDAIAQPLERYVSQQVLWSLALGTIFATPVWPWLRERLAHWAQTLTGARQTMAGAAALVFDPLLTATLFLISAAWLAGGTYNPFIYFRF